MELKLKGSDKKDIGDKEEKKMSDASLILPTGLAPYNRCHIHPMVVFSILDHHIRRADGDRVMGALLGTISEQTGIVEIRNCFPVPHSEGEQVCPPILSLLHALLCSQLVKFSLDA